jgi:AraC-like DNA-binding protein
VQHVEFFHTDHFENNYHRTPPPAALRHFIDFIWETDFGHLWEQYPQGFSDALFPNIGYTYLVNLGTPFVMQVADQFFDMKSDGFLPRHRSIECYHRPGNQLFGIKFKTSPVLFQKKVNFAEYREYIFPLSYLVDQPIIDTIKAVGSFEERVNIIAAYYLPIIEQHAGSLQEAHIVTEILDRCFRDNDFTISIESLAEQYGVSTRTLQRYFEKATSISSKNALQIMRIRKATAHLANTPDSFHYSQYGYYDHSHFYKHLKQFLQKNTLQNLQPHLELLKNLHKKSAADGI